MVLRKEQCAGQKKVPLCVAIGSGWKMVGRFYGMQHLSAKRHRLIVWWEDALWKTFWATIYRTYYSIWFTGWVSPNNCEGSVANPSILERKCYLDCSSDTLCTWVEFGMVTYWSQTLRSWKRWTHRKSTRKDLMRKRWYFPNKENSFIFPIADGRIKTSGGDQDLRTSTLERPRPIQGEGHVDFLGESEGSLPQPHDSFPDAGEAINDFWSMSGSIIYRHHVEPRVKLCSPREESFPVPLKYIDASRTTHTNCIGDCWNIDGSRDLSDPWTGFTQFTPLEEKAPDGHIWSGGWRDWRENNLHPGQIIYGQSSGSQWESTPSWREKQKWSNEAPSWKRAKIATDLFHRPRGYRIQRNHQECSSEIGNTSGSCYALQNS